MAETEKDGLLEDVLNELDITFKDDRLEKKIAGILKRGKAYLNDKFGSEIEFDKDGQAMELLVSYCRYGRSNAIEQFKHDFSSECSHSLRRIADRLQIFEPVFRFRSLNTDS